MLTLNDDSDNESNSDEDVDDKEHSKTSSSSETLSQNEQRPFVFSRKIFLSNPKVKFPKACNYCGTTDHSMATCKRIQWPEPEPLPEMIPEFLSHLDDAVKSVVTEMTNWKGFEAQIDSVVSDVTNAIREKYPTAQLHLYGSSRNGFQVWPSDVDLCLTFEGTDSVPQDQIEEILVNIKKQLHKTHRFAMTIAVTSCRVPVVKFIHRETELEGDICLYNQLALHNTKMLQTYSVIDERCRMLGLMAKHVFKQADVSSVEFNPYPNHVLHGNIWNCWGRVGVKNVNY